MKKIVAYLALLTCATLSLNAGEDGQVILVQQAQTPTAPLTTVNDLPLTNDEKAQIQTDNQTASKKEYARSHDKNLSTAAGYDAAQRRLLQYAKIRSVKGDAEGMAMLSGAATNLRIRHDALMTGMSPQEAKILGQRAEKDYYAKNTTVKTPDGKTHHLSKSGTFKAMRDRRDRNLNAEIRAAKPSAPTPRRPTK